MIFGVCKSKQKQTNHRYLDALDAFSVFTIIIWPVLALAEVSSNEHYVFVTDGMKRLQAVNRICFDHAEEFGG